MENPSFENFRTEVYERENRTKYPNHSHAVKFIQDTPKAKHMPFKILQHFVYKSAEEATKAAADWINNIRVNTENRKAEAEKRRNADKEAKASNFYKEGDIIVNSWGYGQTNIEFYKVMKVGNKTIEIKEISQKVVEGSEGNDCCNVLPGEIFLENGESYTLRVKAEGKLSNPENFYYMHKWDGRPQFKSWYY